MQVTRRSRTGARASREDLSRSRISELLEVVVEHARQLSRTLIVALWLRPGVSRIQQLGGTTKSNVTRKTDYVVVGADPGSKLTRAREMGIKTIDEQEFIDLLGQAS